MKVITENEIIIEKAGKGIYSSAIGPKTQPDTSKAGNLFGKAKDLIGSGKVKGTVDSAKGLAGSLGIGKGKGKSGTRLPEVQGTDNTPAKKAPMSTGMKIGIGVAIVAVLGGIYYFVTKKK